MTKDEFITGYMERSKLSAEHKTADGIKVDSAEMVAIPCNCGADICEGWTMVPNDPDAIDFYLRMHCS